jgi:hypothetical protein
MQPSGCYKHYAKRHATHACTVWFACPWLLEHAATSRSGGFSTRECGCVLQHDNHVLQGARWSVHVQRECE